MENDRTNIYQGNRDNLTQNNEVSRQQKKSVADIKLSPEEIRAFRECNKESFYYRCLPFALTGMAATYAAVQKGYLTPHPKWGPALKMAGASLCGWVLGKFAYRSTCEDKFLKLENSVIGDTIRKRRGYISETFQEERYSSGSKEDDFSPKSGIPKSYGGDYHSSSGSLNFDLDKNSQYSGLDDRERPTADSTPELIKEDEQHTRGTTYDELRRKNRASHDPRNKPTESSQPRSRLSVTQKTAGYGFDDKSSNFDHEESREGNKNVYGDSWEKSAY